jgi:putative PIN family toxin of toxin-antitoxin system
MTIVIDTNVIVAALKSKTGAAYKLVSKIPSAQFQAALSNTLYSEYRDVVFRPAIRPVGSTDDDLMDFLDQILEHADTRNISYLWRPFLSDPKDDMLLEIAVASQAEYIVTYNIRDFDRIELFGIEAVRPGEFLKILETL